MPTLVVPTLSSVPQPVGYTSCLNISLNFDVRHLSLLGKDMKLNVTAVCFPGFQCLMGNIMTSLLNNELAD